VATTPEIPMEAGRAGNSSVPVLSISTQYTVLLAGRGHVRLEVPPLDRSPSESRRAFVTAADILDGRISLSACNLLLRHDIDQCELYGNVWPLLAVEYRFGVAARRTSLRERPAELDLPPQAFSEVPQGVKLNGVDQIHRYQDDGFEFGLHVDAVGRCRRVGNTVNADEALAILGRDWRDCDRRASASAPWPPTGSPGPIVCDRGTTTTRRSSTSRPPMPRYSRSPRPRTIRRTGPAGLGVPRAEPHEADAIDLAFRVMSRSAGCTPGSSRPASGPTPHAHRRGGKLEVHRHPGADFTGPAVARLPDRAQRTPDLLRVWRRWIGVCSPIGAIGRPSPPGRLLEKHPAVTIAPPERRHLVSVIAVDSISIGSTPNGSATDSPAKS